MPPSQAGMVPAALPAFSAPTGVSLPPSWAALSALTAACARPAASTNALVVATSAVFLRMVIVAALPGGSERVLDGEGIEIAIVDLVERRATHLARATGGGTGVGAFDARREAHGGGTAATAAEERRVAQVEHPAVEVVGLETHCGGLASFEEVSARSRGDALHVMVERDARRQRDGRAEHVVVVGARGQAVAPAELRREAADLRERVAQAAGQQHGAG